MSALRVSKNNAAADKAVQQVNALGEVGVSAKIVYVPREKYTKKNRRDIELMHQQLRAMGVK